MSTDSTRDGLVNRFKNLPVNIQEQEIKYLSILLGGATIDKLEDESDDDYRVRSFDEMLAQLPDDSPYPDAFTNTYLNRQRIFKIRTFDLVKDAIGEDGSSKST
ncbi:uncharacterized protein LOC112536769 [Ricinus communis]|uniref:uncharacterized protein LOC112536769 n=1 Tax=Ricinus communis TaxID=3988 RepID=UPI000D698031|nr:uncharacterized protein LOC112536769 [Ricinus communis]|eukprot:XP_025015396.1 uncharacterized protein LOC112536769 [Ricinus communis]